MSVWGVPKKNTKGRPGEQENRAATRGENLGGEGRGVITYLGHKAKGLVRNPGLGGSVMKGCA